MHRTTINKHDSRNYISDTEFKRKIIIIETPNFINATTQLKAMIMIKSLLKVSETSLEISSYVTSQFFFSLLIF